MKLQVALRWLGGVVVLSGALMLAACAVPTTTPVPRPTDAPLLTRTAIPITIFPSNTPLPTRAPTFTPIPTSTPTPLPHPLTIQYSRERAYLGNIITIEETLTPGDHYSRQVVSYQSDGLKIYALLTVPAGAKPKAGWPVVLFNHGYIPPAQYKTTERYVAYVDAFARNGYIVLKSDYRGHGKSEGAPAGYGSPAYTTDVLNAVAALKQFSAADPNRIGMWGHSMGGYITLRNMVIRKDVKAGVIWGGVVGSAEDLRSNWYRRLPGTPVATLDARRRFGVGADYGTPQTHPEFWKSISANYYLQDVSGPLQLHHSSTDEEVPVIFSQHLNDQLKAAGKTSELYIYPGDNHNISANFDVAMQRSVQFMDKYVKNAK